MPKESIDLAVRYIKNLYMEEANKPASAGFGYTGRGREVSPLVYVLAALFVIRYAYLGAE